MSARLWLPAWSSPAARAAPAIRWVTFPPTTPTKSASKRSIRPPPAKGLSDETLHAYVGAAPGFAGPVPEAREVGAVARIVSGPLLQDGLRALRFRRRPLRCRARNHGGAARRKSRRLRLPSLSRDALSRRLPAPPGPDRGGNERQLAARPRRRRPRSSAPRAARRGDRSGAVAACGRRRGRRPRGGAGRRAARKHRRAVRRLVGTAVGEGRLVPGASAAGAGARRRSARGDGRRL